MIMLNTIFILGPYDISDSRNKCFLSVMPFKNQSKLSYLFVIQYSDYFISVVDLCKQFTKEEKLTCVLDYMIVYPDQKKFIFRNYTVLLRHVFKGLCYLKSKGIIHRDIKCEANFSTVKQFEF